MTPEELKELVGSSTNGFHETLVHYNGEVTIYYNDKLHVYWRMLDGEPVVVAGATSVIDVLNKPALVQWAANTTVLWVREKLPSIVKQLKIIEKGVTTLCPWVRVELLEPVLEEARFNFRRISDEAKDTGKMAHGWLESYIKAKINKVDLPTVPEDFPEPAQKCIAAGLAWIELHQVEFHNAERKVYSRDCDVSGTYDWDGFFTGCDNPECCPPEIKGVRVFSLADWKSSKDLYAEYDMQTGFYVMAREEEFPEQTVDVRAVLRLGKTDGAFEPKILLRDSLEADYAGFLGALGAYNWKRQRHFDEKYKKDVLKEEKKKVAIKVTKPRPVKLKHKLEEPTAA